jgi:hypothetical protein
MKWKATGNQDNAEDRRIWGGGGGGGLAWRAQRRHRHHCGAVMAGSVYQPATIF